MNSIKKDLNANLWFIPTSAVFLNLKKQMETFSDFPEKLANISAVSLLARAIYQ